MLEGVRPRAGLHGEVSIKCIFKNIVKLSFTAYDDSQKYHPQKVI